MEIISWKEGIITERAEWSYNVIWYNKYNNMVMEAMLRLSVEVQYIFFHSARVVSEFHNCSLFIPFVLILILLYKYLGRDAGGGCLLFSIVKKSINEERNRLYFFHICENTKIFSDQIQKWNELRWGI